MWLLKRVGHLCLGSSVPSLGVETREGHIMGVEKRGDIIFQWLWQQSQQKGKQILI